MGLALLLVHVVADATAILLGLGALLFFLGIVVGGPLLARLFGRTSSAVLGRTLTGRLASDNMVRNPRRTATTANALVIGLFLVTLVTVSGTAFRDWAMAELDKLTASDFMVVSVTGVPGELLDDVAGIDGVTETAPVRAAQLEEADGSLVVPERR